MQAMDTSRRNRLAWIAVLLVAVVLGYWAVSTNANAEKAPESPDGDTVMARIGDTEILRSDVEATIAGELSDLDRKRHELVEKGLEQAVSEKLIEIEAAAQGMDSEGFIAAQVDAKLEPVTDAEVDSFYEARKSQIQRPKEQVEEQIRNYLVQTKKQEAAQVLVKELRSKHKPEVFLEPMRIEVAEGGAPASGPASAPVKIVEFSDFQCPFCSRVVPTLDRVKETYGDKVRLVFRQFPLHNIHPDAQKAAEASLCANDQGKFWEMHDSMFEQQKALKVDDLKTIAAELELDGEAFAECLDSGRHADQVAADLQAGTEAGVSGTPALFINGRFLSGAQPYDAIANVIDDELRRAGV